MIIECKSKKGNPNTKDVPVSQLINRVGKYLKRTIDGVYDYSTGANTCNLKMVAYYQFPQLSKKPGGPTTYSDLYEMSFDISLTTYANKVRVNLIEISPEEQTLGHFVVGPEKLYDMIEARDLILNKLRKILNKYFEGYEFVF